VRYLIVAALPTAAVLGMWTFKRSLRWCPTCGHHLQCLHCARQPAAPSPTGKHRLP
jgi:heme A synthase